MKLSITAGVIIIEARNEKELALVELVAETIAEEIGEPVQEVYNVDNECYVCISYFPAHFTIKEIREIYNDAKALNKGK